MPVIEPPRSDLNFTPTSTDELSGWLGVTGVAVDGQIVHAVQAVAAGVTGLEAAEAGPGPTALVAATVKVYAVPLVSPVTVAEVAGGLPLTVVGACAVRADERGHGVARDRAAAVRGRRPAHHRRRVTGGRGHRRWARPVRSQARC